MFQPPHSGGTATPRRSANCIATGRSSGKVYGVAEAIDCLQAARDDFGLSQIICWFDQGGMLPRTEVERAMRRFMDKVAPKV